MWVSWSEVNLKIKKNIYFATQGCDETRNEIIFLGRDILKRTFEFIDMHNFTPSNSFLSKTVIIKETWNIMRLGVIFEGVKEKTQNLYNLFLDLIGWKTPKTSRHSMIT